MKNKTCRLCKAQIPNTVKIGDKYHNISSRKYCLDCSPFKGGVRRDFDGNRKGSGTKYKDMTDAAKKDMVLSLYRRALTRKVELTAGGCQVCGYSKSLSALSFHHRDRETKLFGLSLNNLWSKSAAAIKAEAAKCDVLCLNCHAELEQQIRRDTDNNIIDRVNTKYGTDFK